MRGSGGSQNWVNSDAPTGTHFGSKKCPFQGDFKGEKTSKNGQKKSFSGDFKGGFECRSGVEGGI